jgi:RHS repeat-associated protein
LDADSVSDDNELYVRHGALPTPTEYDAAGKEADRADQHLEVSGTQTGNYYVLVRCTYDWGPPDGYRLRADTDSTLPELTVGTEVSGTLAERYDFDLYRLAPGAGEHLILQLDADSVSDDNELYVRHGALPTPSVYDAAGVVPDRPDQRCDVPITQAGSYYVLVRCTADWGPPDGYTLRADTGAPVADAPWVTGHTPLQALPGTFSSIRFSFDRPMNQSSFVPLDDIASFIGPQGDVQAGSYTYTWADPQTLEVVFAAQSATGTYRMVIGPNILDTAGHPMNQDLDSVPGEPTADSYEATVNLYYSGTVPPGTEWGPGVIVVDSVAVPSGGTLTVHPGTIVKFLNPGSRLDVYGVLNVEGTPGSPVVFTGIRDDTAGGDTNGDGSASSPAAGDWQGISFFNQDAASTLNGVVLRYATTGVSVGTYNGDTKGFARLSGVLLEHNNLAMEAGSAYSQLDAENTIVAENAQGFLAVGTARVILRDCTVVGNDSAGEVGYPILDISNSIFAFNAGGFTSWAAAGDVSVSYSLFFQSGESEIADWLRDNGNITSDPLLVDWQGGDYELEPGSPAIDGGLATGAPATDFLGRPRFDDPGTENTGRGFPAYVDLGALERQTATTVADLAVISVTDSVPQQVSPGSTISVSWTVQNTGERRLTGSWHDELYLSADPYLSLADDQLLRQEPCSGDLEIGQTYTQNWTGQVPSGVAGPLYVLARANADAGIREATLINNVASANQALAVDVPALVMDVPGGGLISQGQWAVYCFEAAAGQSVRFNLDAASGSLQLLVRRGAPPTASTFDVGGVVPGQADQEVRLLDPAAGIYYVAVYAQSVPGGSTSYTLAASATSFNIAGATPDSVGNAGPVTVKISGDNFDPTAQAQLVGPGGAVIEGEEYWQDSATLFATFDLKAAGARAGTYDLVVTNPNLVSVTRSDLITVISGGSAVLDADIVVPGQARPNRTIQVTVEYRNTGTIDLPSPLLTIESDPEAVWSPVLRPLAEIGPIVVPAQDEWVTGSTVSFLALSSDGPVTILRPGQSESVTLTVRTPFHPGTMPFTVYSFGTPGQPELTQPIDWGQVGNDIRPPDMPADSWDPLFARVRAQVGTTWGDYLEVLRDNADYLGELNQHVYSAADLFGFEMVQAEAVGSPAYMEAAQDAYCPEPGLPLSFGRYFLPRASYRDRLGALGRGWRHSFEVTLQVRSDGSVVVNGPGGFDHIFESDGSGGYTPSPGDYAILTPEAGGAFLLTEQDGLQTHFRSDGLFDYIRDTSGNEISATYDAGGRLTEVGRPDGDNFILGYGPNGRLVSLTDQAGRVATYGYDASGEHLLSVTGPHGRTTSYTYKTDGDLLTNHNLLSITRPGGAQVFFSYDNLGRLAEQHLGVAEESVHYAYSTAGKITITDALGTTTVWLDGLGRTARVEDAKGYRTDFAYDAASNPTTVAGPTGLSWQFTYDAAGNLISVCDAMGNVTALGYGGACDNLLWVRDANGNMTGYDYDEAGNTIAITYADGSTETFGYDSAGNLVSFTNRRGNATPGDPDDGVIGYEYNARGQLTAKHYADGSDVTFTYGPPTGRLTSATDSTGEITFEYDSNGDGQTTAADNDWVTKIIYPGGQWLEFTYNTAGQRASSFDQTGHELTYYYDEAGRLDYIEDEGGAPVVDYEYDDAGQLIVKTLGNGVYTTYSYDPAGQLVSLVNHAPDGSELSRFDYGYDALGRRVSMDTLDGAWTYEYDAVGQLTRADFASNNVALMPNQHLRYQYDAVGNRVQTIENGVTTEYATNNMNQYVTVGGVAYEYDDDGNLVHRGTTTYAYADENRLVTVDDSANLWQYTYDAFSVRVAATENGVTTRFLVDPIQIGNLSAEYSGSGELTAYYEQGLYGLCPISRTGVGEEAEYYTYDGIGNTVGMTTSGGALVEPYVYGPFGSKLGGEGESTNRLLHIGQYGVLSDANGLCFMRARFYDPIIGRFLSEDPIGLAGGDANMYRYAWNDPVSFIDPTGTRFRFRCGYMSYSEGASDTWGLTLGRTRGFSANLWFFGAQHGWTWRRTPLIGYNNPVLSLGGGPGVSAGWAEGLALGYAAGRTEGFFCGVEFVPEAEPDAPAGSRADSATTALQTSISPEDKWGPIGYDAPGTPTSELKHYILPDGTMLYRIEMWNKPDAPVPTQDATIYDILDPEVFDLSTFQFTRVGFLGWDLPLPGGQAIDTRIDARPDMSIAVDVRGTFDPDTGRIDWWFHTVDPDTGGYPEDPKAGFLPPYNPQTGYEIGWMEFTVKQQADLPAGTQLANQAFVQFDFLGPVGPAPKDGPWINTIAPVAIRSWQQGNVVVSAFDVDGVADVNPNDIQVRFGTGNTVSSVTLGGTQAMSGLGIVVSGASSVGSFKDGRKGTLGDIAFIASDGAIKSIALKGGMTGYGLNGLRLGGLVLPYDIDGDGDTTDATAIYSTGAVGKVSLAGNAAGDIWIGGADAKGLALSSLSTKTGGYHGDLTAHGNVGKMTLAGDFGSLIHVLGSLSSLQIKNADFLGSLDVDGNVSKLSISGGDFLGSIDVQGNLSSFSVKGGKTAGGWLRAGSNVQVGGLLSKASATYHETDNSDEDFGIFAGSFGSVQVAEHKLTQADLPFEEGDFCVGLLP